MVVGDTAVEFYYRDALECVKALFGAPEFASDLIFRPVRHYADEGRKTRVYHDMHTGDWWWSMQV